MGKKKPDRKQRKLKLVQRFVVKDNFKGFDHAAVILVYLLNGIQVRSGFWAGRYDGKLSVLVDHLVDLMIEHNLHSISTTESQQKGALKAIRRRFRQVAANRKIKKGFKVRQRGEFITIVRVESVRFKGRTFIRRLTDIPGYADWRNMRIAVFNCWHEGLNVRYRIIVSHGPSDIQRGSELATNTQARIARIGWPKVGGYLERFQKKHPDAVQEVRADFNATIDDDSHEERFQNWLDDATSMWKNKDAAGTHGRRTIDGIWIYI